MMHLMSSYLSGSIEDQKQWNWLKERRAVRLLRSDERSASDWAWVSVDMEDDIAKSLNLLRMLQCLSNIPVKAGTNHNEVIHLVLNTHLARLEYLWHWQLSLLYSISIT